MKILLLYLVPPERLQMHRFQQGLGTIAAVLKRAGHSVQLVYISKFAPLYYKTLISSFSPDMIGISVTTHAFPLACKISKWFAGNTKLPVILGGIHPTVCPEESIEAAGVFAICRGEGEYPMKELCEALSHEGGDPSRIANLWVKHGGKITRNELRPLISNLDVLPYADREVFHFEKLLAAFYEAEFMGSRGCPFQCAYCVNHSLMELYRGKGTYVRQRSVDNLLEEIRQVVARYSGIAIIGFHDDTFTLNKLWLQDFTQKYPHKINLPFWCNATAESITEAAAELLKKAGCYEVRIGVESGNDHIRMNALSKPVSRNAIIMAFNHLHAVGIEPFAFNMLGLPYETPETMEETVRLNQLIRPRHTFCSIFYPFPGTNVYRECKENGWLTPKNVSSYFESDYVLNQPTVTREQVLMYYSIFKDLVRWPRFAGVIKLLHRIPVTRRKSVWNLCRRIYAKINEAFLNIRTRNKLAAQTS